MNLADLRKQQKLKGAVFGGADDSHAPQSYGDPAAEYRAALEASALIDLTDRVQIEVTGADRVAFLQNFTTNDIKKLSPGEGCEAFVTNIKGRIVAHVLVFAGEDAHWLDSAPGSAELLLTHLDCYLITEDVELNDRSAEWGELGLVGPKAGDVIETIAPGAGKLSPLQHLSIDEGAVRRFDMTLEPGWLIVAPHDQLAELWSRLDEAGALPCGAAAFEALRIEAGFPQHGVDLSEENLAHEAARTQQAISFTKGCFLGQEPIARLEAMGHTNRELRALRIDSPSLPASGAKVYEAEGDKEVGTITSAALSPADGKLVAMAVLRRAVCEPGTEVVVEIGDGKRAGATVFWQ